MKALSTRQPWAWLIVNGHKDVENRNWSTNFRGRVYIHAGLKEDYAAYDVNPICYRDLEPYIWNKLSWDAISDWEQLTISQHLGAIVGEVDIIDCVTESNSPWFQGDYGFVLASPVAYKTPIRCKGRLGFFEPDIEPQEQPR